MQKLLFIEIQNVVHYLSLVVIVRANLPMTSNDGRSEFVVVDVHYLPP